MKSEHSREKLNPLYPIAFAIGDNDTSNWLEVRTTDDTVAIIVNGKLVHRRVCGTGEEPWDRSW